MPCAKPVKFYASNRLGENERDLAHDISLLVVARPLFAPRWRLARKKE